MMTGIKRFFQIAGLFFVVACSESSITKAEIYEASEVVSLKNKQGNKLQKKIQNTKETIQNIIQATKTKRVNAMHVKEIDQQTVLNISKQSSSEFQIIDVRTPEEFQAGHIENAVNISHEQILQDQSLLDPYLEKELIFYCRSGRRVSFVTDSIKPHVFKQMHHLTGDMMEWQQNGLPIIDIK